MSRSYIFIYKDTLSSISGRASSAVVLCYIKMLKKNKSEKDRVIVLNYLVKLKMKL